MSSESGKEENRLLNDPNVLAPSPFPIHRLKSDEAVVFDAVSRKRCRDIRLLLTSIGLSSRMEPFQSRFYLIVSQSDVGVAGREIDSYVSENPSETVVVAAPSVNAVGAGAGVIGYSLVMLWFGFLTAPWGMDLNLAEWGAMQSAAVRSGELWRTITALDLHVDAGHLSSNLVFGALFGLLAGRSYGGGLMMLVAVVAGGLGNLLKAYMQPPEHSSIGASTAVFAILGMLIADSFVTAKQRDTGLRRIIRPVVAGLLLFSYLGIGGPRTDVSAHVCGMLMGVAVGFVCRLYLTGWASKTGLQFGSGLAALVLTLAAWTAAFL